MALQFFYKSKYQDMYYFQKVRVIQKE